MTADNHMENTAVTSKEIRMFIQDNLIYINRSAGEIEYIDKNGCNLTVGFCENVYSAFNKAILAEKKTKRIIY